MRILLTSHLPLEGSATGRSTFDLACGLRAAGHEVECLVVDRGAGGRPEPGVRVRQNSEAEVHALPPKTDEFGCASGLAVRRVSCRQGDRRADLAWDFPCFFSHPRTCQTFGQLTDRQIGEYRSKLRRRLDQSVEAFNPHIIHCQHLWLWAHLALESGVPYAVTAQGPELRVWREDPRYQGLVEQAAENSGRILVGSRLVRDEVHSTFRAVADLVELAPTPLDCSLLQPPANHPDTLAQLGLTGVHGPIVVLASDLAPCEGAETFLNAAAILQMHRPDVTTVLCGDGPQREELQFQARRLGLQRTVFVGEPGRQQRAALMAAADLVVVPSRDGTALRTALEALAQGTPVLAARVGPLPKVLGREVGGLVEPDDHELLAESLLRALADHWKETKGPKGRQLAAEQHALPATVECHLAIYRAILAQRFGAGPQP
jgi:glycosyltransferase involved in cell wall biosynthesis